MNSKIKSCDMETLVAGMLFLPSVHKSLNFILGYCSKAHDGSKVSRINDLVRLFLLGCLWEEE